MAAKRNITKVLLASFLFFAAALLCPMAHAEVVGPGGGGAMFHATISPHNAKDVLVSCDMTGSYISHDGGRSWRMFNLRGTVQFFAFDPNRQGVIYAATRNLWRSTDNGTSWNLLWPKPSTVSGIQMNSDHADETALSNANPMGEVVAFAIDPADSKKLFAGTLKDEHSALFVSDDEGLTWEKRMDLTERPQKIWIDPNSPTKNRDIYIAGSQSITVRHRGSSQIRPAPAAVSFTDISAGFSSRGILLYATSQRGMFTSNDGGINWNSSSLPGKDAQVRAIATSLHHPEIAYASYSHLKLDGKEWMGVAKTMDAGATWSLVWKDGTAIAPNIQDAWVGELGPDWGENPLGLGVAEQNPEICFGTDLGRTMITTNGGKTWHAGYSKKVNQESWVTTGLDVTNSYGYLFDPFNSKRRFIPATDIGLFRSEDNGHSWIRSVNGVPDAWVNTTYWVTFDPRIQNKMWGVMSGTHDLPRPKMWRKTSVDTYKGGVCVSMDGGRSWKPSNSGMPETAPVHILLDSNSPAGKRTLWVAAMGRGVYKSIDDGKTWTLKTQGITQKEPLAWRLARAKNGTLYLVIARRSEDGSIGTKGDGALYKSTDGAETWTPVKLPADVNGPNGLAVDPDYPDRLYLAAWGRAKGMNGTGGGIYLSTDGGDNWKNVLAKDQHVYDVTIDPRNSNLLYAAGFQSSAWRSTDQGENWVRIPGFNFKWGQRVMPDLEDQGKIYISTYGGGVWHIDSHNGAARGDISTPVMQPVH